MFPPSNPFPIPKFLVVLSAIQVVLFYADSEETILLLLEDDQSKRFQVWRFVTHLFVHADPVHLWGNLLTQFLLGCWAKRRGQDIGAIYFISGVGGAIMSRELVAVGCSTALYGLLFAGVMDCVLNGYSQRNRWLNFVVSISATVSISSEIALMLILKNHSFGEFPRFIQPFMGILHEVDWTGHIAGATTGLFTTFILSMMTGNTEEGAELSSKKELLVQQHTIRNTILSYTYSKFAKLVAYILVLGTCTSFWYRAIEYTLRNIEYLRSLDIEFETILGPI